MSAPSPVGTFGERDLIGTYHMGAPGSNAYWLEDPDLLPQRYFHRTYQFQARNGFEVHYMFFADEKCTIPQISGIWEGRCWLLDPHPTLPFTRLADFRLDRVRVAIVDQALFDQTPETHSGDWALGLYKDVSNSGCKSLGPLFGPLERDYTDYDIVYLRDGVLKTGVRTLSMTVSAGGRPTLLQDSIPAMREH